MTGGARLFVISGPSGAGKGTLVDRVRQVRPDLALAVSCTTRSPRDGEVDGESYHFLSTDEFKQGIADGQFLEWAMVHGNYYGTLQREAERCLNEGQSVILEIDPQGALQVRNHFDDAVLLFIAPPDLETLRCRLIDRGSENSSTLQRRLLDAEDEMNYVNRYDEIVINDELEQAVNDLLNVLAAYEKV